MKNNKRPLAPGFINQLDKYLLLNKPDTLVGTYAPGFVLRNSVCSGVNCGLLFYARRPAL